ncbi:tail tape measure protein [Sphingomonas japonica]|uniref:Phage-related minor tail protein n=1 Tax=Sphingomonas japonica TaxID=511662 RepID=A0ABX0TZI2_9SPHN|nr:tail tape measure protein [Sphingomonas japonica]NIJ23735.1 phage-related minor tail protein [Sphingomonas japonica]
MEDEVERLVIGVRADTAAFARDVAEMRTSLEGPFAAGAGRAGDAIERSLLRAVRSGKLGFEDLRRTALAVMGDIASNAVAGGVGAIVGGSGRSGVGGLLSGLLSALSGAPGRATGGPVSPGRPYWVGERGPELFVPTSAGQVQAASGGGRDVRVAITVRSDGGTGAPEALARSSRQVARAVKAALVGVE